jgi:AmiR/NasT family two-component response regulator
MRVLVAQRRTLETRRFLDDLENAGVPVVGIARSSGEAWLLAQTTEPSVVIVSADLETPEAGARLAEKIDKEMGVPCLLGVKGAGLTALLAILTERARTAGITVL